MNPLNAALFAGFLVLSVAPGQVPAIGKPAPLPSATTLSDGGCELKPLGEGVEVRSSPCKTGLDRHSHVAIYEDVQDQRNSIKKEALVAERELRRAHQ